jgi:hypothetical protein
MERACGNVGLPGWAERSRTESTGKKITPSTNTTARGKIPILTSEACLPDATSGEGVSSAPCNPHIVTNRHAANGILSAHDNVSQAEDAVVSRAVTRATRRPACKYLKALEKLQLSAKSGDHTDAAGDLEACERALADVQSAIGP